MIVILQDVLLQTKTSYIMIRLSLISYDLSIQKCVSCYSIIEMTQKYCNKNINYSPSGNCYYIF